MQYKVLIFLIFLYATPPRLGSDGERADGGLKATAAGTVCLQTRVVARRRFQTSGRRQRNRSGGFCCFSTPKSREKKRVFPKAVKGFREVFCCFSPSKSREKSFPKFYAESLRGFREVAVPTNFFLYFWGQKYQKPPHVVLRGSVRAAALHGARKIRPMRHPVADAPQLAPSFSASNESADLLCRRRRHCLYMAMRPGSLYQLTFPEISIRQRVSLFSARRSPTWFRWRESGRKAESASGGDGLLANPRSRPTPLSAFRTPTSESVGWLLLLFDTEKQRKKFFQTFSPEAEKGRREAFCCFSPPKSKVFQAFFCKEQKDIRRLLATYTRKNNQQRILPYSKAPIPSICRANSLRAVRS